MYVSRGSDTFRHLWNGFDDPGYLASCIADETESFLSSCRGAAQPQDSQMRADAPEFIPLGVDTLLWQFYGPSGGCHDYSPEEQLEIGEDVLLVLDERRRELLDAEPPPRRPRARARRKARARSLDGLLSPAAHSSTTNVEFLSWQLARTGIQHW